MEKGLPAATQLDGPEVGGKTGGKVYLKCFPSRAQRVEGGRQSPRGVDDDQVAFFEQPGELGEGGVQQVLVVARGHEHAHRVTGDAAGFGGDGSFEFGGSTKL